jgi:predicted RNA-binding protein YlxR (DUF448 family)
MSVKPKKVPVRLCVACRQPKAKKELLRIVKSPEGMLKLDTTGKAQGRGAYICPEIECLDKAKKTKALERALDYPLTEELYNEVKRVILRRAIT